MVAAGTVLTWRALRTAFLHTSASLKDQLPLFEVLGLSLALLPCAVRRMPRLCSGCKNLHSAWNLHQPLLLQWRHTIVLFSMASPVGTLEVAASLLALEARV